MWRACVDVGDAAGVELVSSQQLSHNNRKHDRWQERRGGGVVVCGVCLFMNQPKSSHFF